MRVGNTNGIYCGCFSHNPLTASRFTRWSGTNSYSATVDIYNDATGLWSTAKLSAARIWFAATSVGNVALFAGGSGPVFGSSLVDVYNSTYFF